jgi:hypothetical protein
MTRNEQVIRALYQAAEVQDSKKFAWRSIARYYDRGRNFTKTSVREWTWSFS